MSVELRPLGVKCNLHCQYCYQNPQRDAGNIASDYDIEQMKAAVEADGGGFTLFGGEPLMVPEDDLETLWAWGLEKYGHNGVQTNGSLITDRHIRMFRKYRVFVGMSLDGPGELNDARWAGTLDRTRDLTKRSEAAIERLCVEGIPPALIVTLHRGNATADKLPRMHDWFRYLQGIGVSAVRLHILEVENAFMREKYALSTQENLEAFLSFAQLEKELTTLHLDLFADMRNLLAGSDDSATCVWQACDPYTTRAVRGVEGHGQRSNCGRTNKDGIDFTKADQEGFERYIALYCTPQSAGGCKDCRYFLMCKGQCPGTAIDGDWRNRTEHCDVWKGLYRHLEDEMLSAGQLPVSASPRRRQIEETFIELWSGGRNSTISRTAAWLDAGKPTRSDGSPDFGASRTKHIDHTDYAKASRPGPSAR